MKGVQPPPSLANIFTEIKNDLKIEMDMKNGDLESWAHQGVLLLNTIMTVKKGAPMSKGWEFFTTHIIQYLNVKSRFIVFLLWGKSAQEKKKMIDCRKHLVLTASHPSPKSCDMGNNPFMGCKHFSKTNVALKKQGLSPINWDNNK
jgi:uracil-DNA glycosylase